MTRVLVVDDEDDLRETLAFQLEEAGFEVAQADTGAGALKLLADGGFELLVLDLMLPDKSGLEVCRELRARPETKDLCVLMLTARGEEIDRVIGFEMGADDYVVKPFSTRELVLRLKALSRRGRGAAEAVEPESLRFGVLAVDLAGHRVHVGGEEISLTALEFKLLSTLMQRKGRVQSRERLLVDVWEMSPDVATRTVDTHIKRLREKLGEAGDYVETVRGAGYRFRDREPG